MGGVILALAISLAGFQTGGQRLTPELVLLLLVYFGLGLILLSQARLAVLQARWQLDGVVVASGVGRRWVGMGGILVGGVALASLLLPTRFTAGLLAALQTALFTAIALFAYLLQVILVLVSLLVGLVLGTMGMRTVSVPPLPKPVLPSAPSGMGPEFDWGWLEWLRAGVFWVALIILLVVGIRRYLLDRPELVASLRQTRLIRWLLELSRWGQRWRQRLRPRRRPKREAVADPATEGWRWPSLRLNRLGPRELARYFYLSLMHRAAERGWERRPDQSASEYSAGLKARMTAELPVPTEGTEIEAEVDRLTQAFIEARYSARSFTPPEVSGLRRVWERLRRRIRP
jgi:hypothetical protein